MLSLSHQCRHCGSHHLVSNGHAANGKLRYQCRACKRYSRLNRSAPVYDEKTKAQILAAYHERCSLRGLTRIFGVSRNTVSTWLKKSGQPAAAGADPGSSPSRRSPGV